MKNTMETIMPSNKFEEKGMELQNSARTFEQAKKRFNNSCTLCCLRNREGRDNCGECPIRKALLANNGVKWHCTNDEDYMWMELEEASV